MKHEIGYFFRAYSKFYIVYGSVSKAIRFRQLA